MHHGWIMKPWARRRLVSSYPAILVRSGRVLSPLRPSARVARSRPGRVELRSPGLVCGGTSCPDVLMVAACPVARARVAACAARALRQRPASSNASTLLRVGTLNKFEQTNPFNAFNFTTISCSNGVPLPDPVRFPGKIIPDFPPSGKRQPTARRGRSTCANAKCRRQAAHVS